MKTKLSTPKKLINNLKFSCNIEFTEDLNIKDKDYAIEVIKEIYEGVQDEFMSPNEGIIKFEIKNVKII